IVLSFEEALKVHLSLGQELAKLNSYNRATAEGKRTAIDLCLYPHKKRITIVEVSLPKQSKNKDAKKA
ncbi:MAG: hypothetical protein AAB288_10375, partial [Acidobacteriota bacterium]